MAEKKMPLSDRVALAGNRSDKGTGNAVKHGDRIAALGACKQRSREMSRHLRDNGTNPQHARLHALMRGCANYLVFNNYYTVDEIRLAKVRTCKKHLLCPFCARTRAAKLTEKQLERVSQVMAENPKLIPAMLTLTVKNRADLQDGFKHLMDSFRKLQKRRRDWNEKGRGYTEFAKINGAVFSVEFTHSAEGWHPHLHAFVLLDDYIDQKALSEEWHRITGDSFVVGITKIKAKDSTGQIVDGIQEVFKYALKFGDLSLEKNLEAYESLLGKRLLGSFGSLHGVKVPEKDTDELLTDLPYIEMFYKFAPQKGSYELTDTKKQDYDPRNDDDGTELELSRYEPVRRDQSNGSPQVCTLARSAGLPECSNGHSHYRNAERPDKPCSPSFSEAEMPY